MSTTVNIAQLQREILPLQGYKAPTSSSSDVGLGPINQVFPLAVFPTAAVHEFLVTKPEEATAASGFISGILSTLMSNKGTVIWIGEKQNVFPSALTAFGIEPNRIIFITVKNQKQLLWATEEALKSKGLAAVISEVADYSFTDSRRFQLAVEGSGVTGFFIRHRPRNLQTACISRWRVSSIASKPPNKLPGIGFPRWQVELLKVRNGKPGVWQMEWGNKRFVPIYKTLSIAQEAQRKIG